MAAHDFVLLNALNSDGKSAVYKSSEATGYGVSNLFTPYPHQRWRTTGTTSEWVGITQPGNWGGSVVYHLWMGYTNARNAGDAAYQLKWEVKIYTSAGAAGEGSGLQFTAAAEAMLPNATPNNVHQYWPDGVACYRTFTNTSGGAYFRINFSEASGPHPDGYLQFGRLLVAIEPQTIANTYCWRPSRGPSYGESVPTERPVPGGARADGGGLYPEAREAPTFAAYDFKNCSFDDYQRFRRFVRTVKAGVDVVALQDTPTTEYLPEMHIHGVLKNVDAIRASHASAGAVVYDIAFDVESLSG